MKLSVRHPALRKRVVFIFLGAVLLPGLILSYFGLRTIHQYHIVSGQPAETATEYAWDESVWVPERPAFIYYISFSSLAGLFLAGVVFVFRDVYREKELARLQTEFLSELSHEIRSPIAAIRMLVGNLHEGLVEDPAKQKVYLQLIDGEARRLSNMAEYILDSSRMSRGGELKYRTERVSLSGFLRNVLDRFPMYSDHMDFILSVRIDEDLPEAEISPGGIEEAIFNLLDNAVKHSDKEKHVEFSASAANGEVLISVADYGIGIPKKELQKIFEKFYRSSISANRKIPGNGIGLSIVRDIMYMHKGRVEVKSSPGRGSTFSLILPVKKH